jgi:hypothetical protein
MYRRRYRHSSAPKFDPKPCPYAIAEGPVPQDVWEHSQIVGYYNLVGYPEHGQVGFLALQNRDGIATTIARSYGNGVYLQVADFLGWQFYCAHDTRIRTPEAYPEI